MYERHKYKSHEEQDWKTLQDPVGFIKYDGANYFLQIGPDGSQRYFSRRPSVKGGFPERTEALPHITSKKLPQHAGEVYNVELIHTGWNPDAVESHPMVSGILNSLPARAVATQKEKGPVRVIVHNVISPSIGSLSAKLLKMKTLEESFGDPDIFKMAEPHFGHAAVHKLNALTRQQGREGTIIASLNTPEDKNPRIKIKHLLTYNLLITGMEEEIDKNGKPKGRMGALVCVDRSGREVAKVGSGFDHATRQEAWDNKSNWIGKLIQVKTMGLAARKLRQPIYNGEADGALDMV